MKALVLAYSAMLGLAIAGTAMAEVTRPMDTGNMAYPAPRPQGNLSTTTAGGSRPPADTGNMVYPAPLPQGNLSTTTTGVPRTPMDIGNMAYPAPATRGNFGNNLAKQA